MRYLKTCIFSLIVYSLMFIFFNSMAYIGSGELISFECTRLKHVIFFGCLYFFISNIIVNLAFGDDIEELFNMIKDYKLWKNY